MYKQIDPNKYAGPCVGCGNQVSAGAGRAELIEKGARWTVRCRPCVNGTTPVPEKPVDNRPTHPLTEEQQIAVDKFQSGDSLAVQAGAGTGKTSTLVAIANSTDRHGQYVAFNKPIVVDAGGKLPRSCAAATAHALANRQVGHLYRHRLDSQRQSSHEIARKLNIKPFFYTNSAGEPRVIQPNTLASHVAKAITTFCNTADEKLATKHIAYIDGIDENDDEGKRTYVNNNLVKQQLKPALRDAWLDIIDPDGTLRFTHDCYLKIWELGIHGDPIIPGDYILFDEAQDASPVLLSAVEQQNKQVVFVGDGQQAIYEWRGAVDAMNTVPADSTCFLTNSFRFGPEIAKVANQILSTIESAQLRLVGLGKPGKVEIAHEPDAVLCRTNAGAVGVVLEALDAGKTPHLVGGGGEIESFAKAAGELQETGSTTHPELSIFSSWGEVEDYVANDPQGTDLTVQVKLINDYGVEKILRAVGNKVSEQDADLVVTTAHKSKGREWDTVRIHGDFPPERDDDGERRLLYVAVTRARLHLDIEYCEPARKIVYHEDAEEAKSGLPSDYWT
jgi:hypothetical protein